MKAKAKKKPRELQFKNPKRVGSRVQGKPLCYRIDRGPKAECTAEDVEIRSRDEVHRDDMDWARRLDRGEKLKPFKALVFETLNQVRQLQTEPELAKSLGISPFDGPVIEFRVKLLKKIGEVQKKKRATSARVAKDARVSPAEAKSLLNGRMLQISTEKMIRVLSAMGVGMRIEFRAGAGRR